VIRIAIIGAAGRMGMEVLRVAMEDREVEVTGLVERKDHPVCGKEARLLVGRDLPLLIEDEVSKVIERCDVLIDFSSPSSTLSHFTVGRQHGKAMVIGTTGIPEDVMAQIHASRDVRVVLSPNMSVGVNLMFELIAMAARVLSNYDVEIVEFHHRWKKDAPSGTALRLKEIVKTERGLKKEVFGRHGVTGERTSDEIGIMSLRGGDVVGEHTVIFAKEGERLEITHRASSRENFARGAIRAAKWVVDKPYGIYSMRDVLFS
jgi:4-hydroxy-tetrahydrodipicolinate reductase